MNIRPIRKINISDDIANQIKESIINGSLKAGERLPAEVELAQRFEASRTSVREAIRGLVSLGLIERTREGTYVSTNGMNFLSDPLIYKLASKRISIDELLETRKTIEVPIAEMAAVRRDDNDIEQIEKSIESMKRGAEDPHTFSRNALDFHLAVALASKNLILYELVYAIKHLQMVSNMEVVRSNEVAGKTLAHHEKILAAIKRRDPLSAGKNMAEHISDVEMELKKLGKLKS